MNSVNNYNPVVDSCYFDWTQRPESLQGVITKCYEQLANNPHGRWSLYNGKKNYEICGVNEYALMKDIILKAPFHQQEFYALDIGAGDFQWGHGLAAFIDAQTDLPNDISVHIIGVKGEAYLEEKVITTKRCIIHKLGAFKIEELFASFIETGLEVESNVDLIVSRWCFRHLADPVGTFAQAYNLLRPGSGYLLIDGFFFLYEGQKLNHGDGNMCMTQLFLDTKAPFLTQSMNPGYSLNQFILQSADAEPCSLPMQYLSIEVIEDTVKKWGVNSRTVTRFQRQPQESDREKHRLPCLHPEEIHYVYGDKNIFDHLQDNGLFVDSNREWRSLKKNETENLPK